MLKCPKAVGEEIPEDDDAGRCELRHIGRFDHREVQTAFERHGDEPDNGEIQRETNQIDDHELRELRVQFLVACPLKGPSLVPNVAVNHRDEERGGCGDVTMAVQCEKRQIEDGKADDRAADTDYREFEELTDAVIVHYGRGFTGNQYKCAPAKPGRDSAEAFVPLYHEELPRSRLLL